MSDEATSPDPAARWKRGIARAISTVAALFWAFTLLSGAVVGASPLDPESAIMAALITASVLGVVIAWKREGLGGAAVLLCGAAHTIFACLVASRNRLLAIAVAGLPFLLSGLLFLGSWWDSRRAG